MKLSRWQRIRWNIDGDLDRLERALWWALAVWLPVGVGWIVYDTVQRY